MGQLGVDGPTGHDLREPAPEEHFVAVSAGVGHTCAIRTDGALLCWGSGPVGVPDGTEPHPPTEVNVDLRRDWVRVASGGAHTCAATADDTIFCWGDTPANAQGAAVTAPTPVLLP